MQRRLAPTAAAAALLLATSPARADLVAHYAFDAAGAAAGDALVDSVGGNHGRLINPAQITTGVPAPRPALGTAFTFGLRAGVDLGDAPEVRPIDQFTLTWWMRPDTLNAFDRIYETLAGTGNNGNGIRIDLGGAGDEVRVLLRDGNGSTNTQVTHPLTLDDDGTWYFVAVRYDSTQGDATALRLTVLEAPGAEVEVGAADVAAGTASPGGLGTGPIDLHATGAFLAADDASASGNNDYGGGLDDFALFQTGDSFGVLTDAEVATVCNLGALGFDPPSPPPEIASFTAARTDIEPGEAVDLTWSVSGAETVEIQPGVGAVGPGGSVSVSPDVSTVYTLTATGPGGTASATVQVNIAGDLIPPSISEFVASNTASLQDGDGGTPDWIELHNPNTVPFDLSGYTLTDDPDDPTRWAFPEGIEIAAGGYLVVFASAQAEVGYTDAGGHLHTTFSLDADGEYLALVAPGGEDVIQAFTPAYPRQFEDVSFGPGGYFRETTPGAASLASGVQGFVADTRFSHDRGIYTEPFAVEITTATEEATILYTTDGRVPSLLTGQRYTGPVEITGTTVLRAVASRAGFAPTNVDTQTYLFLDDVLRQPADPPGHPTTWAGRAADYEMDPEIVEHPAYAGVMEDALRSFPTLSLVLNPDDFYGAQGIYQNPQSQGSSWERPVSAELFDPAGGERGFQIDAGLRIQGGSSRNPDTPKHSLSLRFRKQYGAAKLNYPIFRDAPGGGTAVRSFDFLQLRSGYNFGWTHRHYYQSRHAQYNRDQWANDLYLAMGQTGSHGRWVHLYINGLYWGVYHIHERPDADFMASYFGGSPDDYDALNSGNATDGNKSAWDAMVAIANGNIAGDQAYRDIQDHLNIDALIDYMLLNFYVGNRDWDGHNWRAARRREPGAGYLMFPWDTEFAISPNNAGVINSPAPLTNALNTDLTNKNGNGRPSGLHQRLALNADYRMRFADRVHRHCFNDGALTPGAAEAAWRRRSEPMDTAIVAESARWGDFRRDVDSGRWAASDFDRYTRDEHYLPDQAYILGTYLPQRTAIVVEQLRGRDLYPDVDAPAFTPHGGIVPAGFQLAMENPGGRGTIRYTLDGTDPREGDAPTYTGPVPLPASGLVRARVFTGGLLGGGEWSALNEAFFIVGTPAAAGNIVVSELHFNPAGAAEDTEFIELLNISDQEIELTGARFVDGVEFTFLAETALAPGARLVVVGDAAAFAAAYGDGVAVAGEYSGNLDNGGEAIALAGADGAEIERFTYRDNDRWPAAADDRGFSLVRVRPRAAAGGAGGPGPDDPAAWRPSLTVGGNPGTSDSRPFAGGGAAALLQHALGTGAGGESAGATTAAGIGADGFLTFRFCRDLAADDVTVEIETSDDLLEWVSATASAALERVEETDPEAGTGTVTTTYRGTAPAALDRRRFVRLRVRLLQP